MPVQPLEHHRGTLQSSPMSKSIRTQVQVEHSGQYRVSYFRHDTALPRRPTSDLPAKRKSVAGMRFPSCDRTLLGGVFHGMLQIRLTTSALPHESRYFQLNVQTVKNENHNSKTRARSESRGEEHSPAELAPVRKAHLPPFPNDFKNDLT